MKSIATITIERDDGETYVFDNIEKLSFDVKHDINGKGYFSEEPVLTGFNNLIINAGLFPEKLKEDKEAADWEPHTWD